MFTLLSKIIGIEQALLKIKYGDLYNVGVEFFKAIDYPVIPLKDAINMDINKFIFFTINKRIHFSIEEFDFLNNIKSISTLFSIDACNASSEETESLFFRKILFIAIDIDCQRHNRSFCAHSITKIINKIYDHPIFIFFHCRDYISFSGLLYENLHDENSSKVYLSDWYNCEEIGNIPNEKLHSLNFTNQNSTFIKELYYDMIFAISRDYYIYPESLEYLAFGCIIRGTNEPLNERIYLYKNKNELYRERYQNYFQQYGDDFVSEEETLEVAILKDDIFLDDFLTLNGEEINIDSEHFEQDDECIGEEINEEDDSEFIEDEDIEEECFEDPIKMLEWLSKMENNQ